MKRTIALVAVLTFAGASPVFAESKFDFSAKAAGIESLVRADQAAARSVKFVAATPTRAPQANGKKSFWKTPWPYLIIGGAVAAGVLIASNSGNGSGY